MIKIEYDNIFSNGIYKYYKHNKHGVFLQCSLSKEILPFKYDKILDLICNFKEISTTTIEIIDEPKFCEYIFNEVFQ